MKRAKRWLLISAALLVLAVDGARSAAPFKKVALATTAKSTTSTTASASSSATTEAAAAAVAEADEAKPDNATAPSTTKNSKLTGIPQIDYIWDPNLPRELHGFNLSSYPFFATTPPEEDIHFKCDGLHDGFYASIEHHCQVYHHCVYGIRHDFLCANFTAFDQKTFICHFVSDVDCQGSQKYWNRNDALYMATTTTSTTTTTTEPPPTPRRRPVRPSRPLRRPQRPIEYYSGEDYKDDYIDEYYEEQRPQRRRNKQHPRQRKPALDYDNDYYDHRSFDSDVDQRRRRPSSRDRFRDDEEQPLSDDDYELERRKYDRPRSRNNNRTVSPADRRKAAGRKPLRPAGEERRSFSGDERPAVASSGRRDKTRPLAADDEADDVAADVPPPPRRQAGRRRINEKRPTSTADLDDLDEYEKPKHALDQEEAAGEESPPKVKTTPKPLEEFVTPKAAPASVFARPRAPPRIARPVPVNEKKKYQYPVQKTGTTAAPDAQLSDDDYYAEDEYEDVRGGGRRGSPSRRRVVDDDAASKVEEEEEPVAAAPPPPNRRRAGAEAGGRKQTRPTLRKPVTDKKPPLPLDEEEYESGSSAERYDSRAVLRRRPYAGRTRGGAALNSARGNDDVDFVDDDYDERPLRPVHRLSRPKAAALTRKTARTKTRPAANDEEEVSGDDLYEPEVEQSTRMRATGVAQGRRKVNSVLPTRLRQATTASSAATAAAAAVPSSASIEQEEVEAPAKDTLDTGEAAAASAQEGDSEAVAAAGSKAPPTATANGRPASVRVVKRPFLPSRGGSPYLPRGLQPVGLVAHRPTGSGSGSSIAGGGGSGSAHTTDSAPIDMGSTISGVRLLEHGAPLLRDSGIERTTLPPRSALPVAQTRIEPPPLPKATLDELYENDYDVTLNDALNPTLKPLAPPHANVHQLQQQHSQLHHQSQSHNQQQQHHSHTAYNHHQQHANRNYPNVYGSVGETDAASSAMALDSISDTDSISAASSATSHSPSSSASVSASSPASNSNAFVNNNLYHHQLQQQQQQQQQLQQQQHQQQHHHHQQQQQQQQYAFQSIPASASASSSSPSHHQHQHQASLSLSQSQAHHQRQMQMHAAQLQHQQSQHSHMSPVDGHHHQQHQQQQQPQQQQEHTIVDDYDRDSYFSSTDIRRRAIIAAPPPRTSSRTDYRGLGTRIAQHFYDDFEY